MLVITGANGPFGRRVVERLLTRVPADDLAVSVRDTAAAGDLAARGVRVRHGDFDAPDTLVPAFEGARTVLLNATNYGTDPARRAAQQAHAIRAAGAAGARRIVLTSWHDPDNCPLDMVSDYPGTERLLAESGGAWTVLRMVYGMAASLARDVHWAMAAGVLAAPAGDARATPAATEDLAEATANVLAEGGAQVEDGAQAEGGAQVEGGMPVEDGMPVESGVPVEGGHDGRTYELTGPDAIVWDDLARLAATLGDRPIGYRPVTDDEFRAQVRTRDFPPEVIDALIAYYRAFRAGWANAPTTDLARLLHRPPTASLDAVRAAMSGAVMS